VPTGGGLPTNRQYYAATDGKLFAAIPGAGSFTFDTATGKPIPLPVHYVVGPTRHPIRARGRRVYIASPTGISAVDTGSREIVWSTRISDASIVAATDDAVYAIGIDDTLHAFDPATGVEAPSFGLAGLAYAPVETAGEPRSRGPVVVACDRDRMLALGPSTVARPTEHATITGKLLCRGCNHTRRVVPLANVRVSALGFDAMTDASGRFRLSIAARGSVRVEFDLPSLESSDLGWVDDVSQVVRLRDKHHYALGAIGAKQR